ncbi:MAG: hypothetical protein ABI700_16365, partial [Chloroflexota bacterium]
MSEEVWKTRLNHKYKSVQKNYNLGIGDQRFPVTFLCPVSFPISPDKSLRVMRRIDGIFHRTDSNFLCKHMTQVNKC